MDLTQADGSDLRLRANILMEEANNAWYQARYQEAQASGRLDAPGRPPDDGMDKRQQKAQKKGRSDTAQFQPHLQHPVVGMQRNGFEHIIPGLFGVVLGEIGYDPGVAAIEGPCRIEAVAEARTFGYMSGGRAPNDQPVGQRMGNRGDPAFHPGVRQGIGDQRRSGDPDAYA